MPGSDDKMVKIKAPVLIILGLVEKTLSNFLLMDVLWIEHRGRDPCVV